MDEADILGATIKFMRHLQQRVQILEQHQTSVQPYDQEDSTRHSSGSGHGCFHENQQQQPPPLPPAEIETRVSGRSLLLRFHCRKNKGVLVRILSEVERLNLAIINTSVTPYGSLALGITIIAEMEEEGNATTTGVVESLRSAVRRFVIEG